ncbi:MAG TPA: TonB-dependent receptor [Vicinamibacterales bacterium]|nr:TonB-dependent receptor [Vicinamibacterales bacterium]
MTLTRRVVGVTGVCLLVATLAYAQVQTGSITGVVADTTGAILPGATVSLSGEKLIGGVQTKTADANGAYRFDRLPPGAYTLKFEMPGFRTVQRDGILVSASFVATVNPKLEVGQMNETVAVTGESPTIDTKSNVQQTVMNQDILEGVPTGRDPWSLAKIIPGVQISTYDVGGTQSYQQSSLSAHGSNTSDVNYNIDGSTVNWPGGGGGATMLYYDQGMFEEVNYTTSAVPAEVMVGGVSINMVTKEAGNTWRGNAKYYYSNGDHLQSDNTDVPELTKWSFLGNPIERLYDFNVNGGGALVRDRVWVTGSFRRWVVDKVTNALNADGTRAVDDNTISNYSGKGVWQATSDQKIAVSVNYNNKVRGHRRNTPPNFAPDIASLHQNNPATSTQVKYTNAIRGAAVYESSFSVMSGKTEYLYQEGTPPDAIRVVDNTLSTADKAAQYQEINPNSRIQFDNALSYTRSGWGGDHLFKVGVQFARLRFLDEYTVQGDMYLEYSNGVATQVRQFNTPTSNLNIERALGLFAQDAWTIGSRLTLNLGVRVDINRGIIPAQSNPAGSFIGERTLQESTPIKQTLGVWRTGLSYDPFGDGATAIKASYSRYGSQLGIDRVQNINPFNFASQTCPWSDGNHDGMAQSSEVGTCSGFPTRSIRYADANGPSWPYSDEISAGIEREVGRDMRIGVMYYHRTNRNQVGTRNVAVPPSAYTEATVAVPGAPNGPGGIATFFNLDRAYLGQQDTVLDNEPYLDTSYNGVEFTANKRFSRRWQMMAGLTIGKNKGGVNSSGGSGQSGTLDLNDPNNTRYPNGVIGNDSRAAFRLAASYRAPFDITVAGSVIANTGYPYVSTYTVTRSIFPGLVRSSQAVLLSSRGDERLPAVTMVDLRISRPFSLGNGRRFSPQVDIFNIGNASTIVSYGASVGQTYLRPGEIVAPRIVRVGFSVDF